MGVGKVDMGVRNRRNAHKDIILDEVSGCALFGFSGRRWSGGVEGVSIAVVVVLVVVDGAGACAEVGAVVIVGLRITAAAITDGEVNTSGGLGRTTNSTVTGTTTTTVSGRGDVGVVIITPIIKRKSHDITTTATTTFIPSTITGS